MPEKPIHRMVNHHWFRLCRGADRQNNRRCCCIDTRNPQPVGNRNGSGQALQWRHNERDGVSNHQPHHCLLKRLFRYRLKKISKLRVTGLCAGNSTVTGEFPAKRASNEENVSIWWRHHGTGRGHKDHTWTQLLYRWLGTRLRYLHC